MTDPLAMDRPREHCSQCGRGSNFKLPKIVIDWDKINRQQFEAGRDSLLQKIDDIEKGIERSPGGYFSSNWFSASDMGLIIALLRAAAPQHREGQS